MARKVEVDQKEGMVLKRIHGDSKVSTIFLNFQSNWEMIQFDGHIIQLGWFNLGDLSLAVSLGDEYPSAARMLATVVELLSRQKKIRFDLSL